MGKPVRDPDWNKVGKTLITGVGDGVLDEKR